MSKQELIISKLVGYSGIRLKNENPLRIKPGINLLVGRNGSGKTNLLKLLQFISRGEADLTRQIESEFYQNQIQISKGKNSDSIRDAFGQVTIVEYKVENTVGSIFIKLKDNVDDMTNLVNLSSYQNNIVPVNSGPNLNWHNINHSGSIRKLEMSGYMRFNFFSSSSDRD
ncbi:MAG: ABC transporter ATP-binding protein, partial [Fulvivirga sp.]|uniref:ABC transporter ATP-binding protein n=1 Tax=Fulvivirga sp. TaxID=1931237 RepID=UPI0032EB0C95